MVDRSEVSRALAKAIAYHECGKQADAEAWACELVHLLDCAGILTSESQEAAMIHERAGNR
jgi:hypothetical protein